MTDLELTNLCAEAMKFSVCGSQEPSTIFYPHPNGSAVICVYDPLHDDAQAMALVKKFTVIINYWKGWQCGLVTDATGTTTTLGYNIRSADLNRAICECVAKMQAAK